MYTFPINNRKCIHLGEICYTIAVCNPRWVYIRSRDECINELAVILRETSVNRKQLRKIEMKIVKILPVIIFLFFLGCNPKSEKAESKVSKRKLENNLNAKTVKHSDNEKINEIICDTLVFDENMKGKLLENKFAESKSELNFYKKFIKSKKINVPKILKTKSTKTKITYLGELKDLNHKNSYHIITNFEIWGIGEMLSPRGRSKVAFINETKNKILIYDLGMPENLPVKIENNILYFKIEKSEIKISILGGLSPELCIPKIGCN